VGTNDIFAGMGPDVINGPGFNYGYAGGSFGVGAGFFNVRPAAGATGVNPSLRFMTVNLERMIVTNAGNIGIGTSAPSQKLDVAGTVNVAGDLALPATTSATVGVITLGGSRFAHNFGGLNTFLGASAGNFTMSGLAVGNTAVGNSALQANTDGFYNTATGLNSLLSNTTGTNNTATGFAALNNNTTGYYNTASGNGALYNNTTGYYNTASGNWALYYNTTGYYNTASGGALFNNTTGYYNTASGNEALYYNTTGFYNTAVGYRALFNNTTGVDNFGFGALAGNNLTTGNHNIDIANQGVAAEGNTIRIGSGAQTRAFIGGIRGVTTGAADAVAVVIDSNGQLGTASSSRRYKFDIASMGEATDGLMRLRPVTFRYLAHGENAPLQYGLIAEEVAEVYPELVTRNKDGEVETVMYQFLAPMLLNEVQKQQKTIDGLITTLSQRTADLQAETNTVNAENAALRDQVEQLMRRVEQLEAKTAAAQ
jgi:polyhydroxyalkanoate synthesis regulator phasin